MELDESRAPAEAEGRQIKWCGKDEAVRLLSFGDARSHIEAASRHLERRGR
jgi:hypothetical protein